MPKTDSKYKHVRIAQVVEEQGRKKVWLAERVGVTPSHLTYLLRGERVWTAERKARACAALGLDPNTEGLFEYPAEECEGDDGGDGSGTEVVA